MPKTEPYTEGPQERRRDGQHAAEYLKACLADDDPGVFLLGLRDVADAHGGIRQVSEKTNLNQENLYRDAFQGEKSVPPGAGICLGIARPEAFGGSQNAAQADAKGHFSSCRP